LILPKKRYTIFQVSASSERHGVRIFQSSQLPKLPSHAADHVGGPSKKPLVVPLHAGSLQLAVDRELDATRQRKHGNKRALLKREAPPNLNHSSLNMLAPTDFREFARTANVEISSPPG